MPTEKRPRWRELVEPIKKHPVASAIGGVLVTVCAITGFVDDAMALARIVLVVLLMVLHVPFLTVLSILTIGYVYQDWWLPQSRTYGEKIAAAISAGVRQRSSRAEADAQPDFLVDLWNRAYQLGLRQMRMSEAEFESALVEFEKDLYESLDENRRNDLATAIRSFTRDNIYDSDNPRYESSQAPELFSDLELRMEAILRILCRAMSGD